LKLANFFTSFW